MKPECFSATLVSGHKEAAFEVPFDPADRWSAKAVPIRPGRRGYAVTGKLDRTAFESFVVSRSRRFWLLVDEELQKLAKLEIGDRARIELSPRDIAAPARPKNRRSADAALAKVRSFCLALPETTEKMAWGEATFRVKDKIFAMFSDNHHHDNRISIICNAPDGAQQALVASDPEHFYVPPYVGGRGWLGIRADGKLPIATIIALVEQAYRVTAPRRVLQAYSR